MTLSLNSVCTMWRRVKVKFPVLYKLEIVSSQLPITITVGVKRTMTELRGSVLGLNSSEQSGHQNGISSLSRPSKYMLLHVAVAPHSPLCFNYLVCKWSKEDILIVFKDPRESFFMVSIL